MYNQKCVSMVILKPDDNENKPLHCMREIKFAIWYRKECELSVVGKLSIEKTDIIVKVTSVIKEKP